MGFGKSLSRAIKGNVKGVSNIVKNPGKSIKGAIRRPFGTLSRGGIEASRITGRLNPFEKQIPIGGVGQRILGEGSKAADKWWESPLGKGRRDAPEGETDMANPEIAKMEAAYNEFDPEKYAQSEMEGARRDTGLMARKAESDVTDSMQERGQNAAYSGRAESSRQGVRGQLATQLSAQGAQTRKQAMQLKEAMKNDITAAKAGVELSDLNMRQKMEEISAGVSMYRAQLTSQATNYLGQALGNIIGSHFPDRFMGNSGQEQEQK